MGHPTYFPDLNPIQVEYVWVELKKQLRQQYPRIGYTSGAKKAVRRRLAQVLPLVCETILEGFFEKLCKLMPNRVAAVLEARGGYPKYQLVLFIILLL